ncbi:MAG: hypothetical protein KatS3mg011_0954 [Acidimicrobiia bacterium]|nr:MAG: hypothetical protein KatS3mg011_0954 [Acidimicrobiia bacterium]
MTILAALAAGTCAGALVWAMVGPRREPKRRRLAGGTANWRSWMGALGLGFLVGVTVLGLTGVWAVAVPPALFATAAPHLYHTRTRDRAREEIRRAWPDGLRDLVASVTSGMSLRQAVEALAATGPEPLRRAFSRFPVLARTVGLAPALERIRSEVAEPTTDRVIEVLVLADEHGGPAVPAILRDLATATTRDLWAEEEARTAALEQKINSRVVFVLPWLILVLLTVQDGGYRAFYRSPAGLLVIAAGAALSLVGLAIAVRLGSTPPEPRVVVGGKRP